MIALPNQIPEDDENPSGVLGDGALLAGKHNMVLIRRAIREDWPIPPDLRVLLVRQMGRVMKHNPDARNKIAAAKVLVAADAVNQRREAMDQADEHKRMPNLNMNLNVDVPPTVFEIIDGRNDRSN